MLEYIHKISWAIATIFLLFSSVYFGIKLRFLQCNLKKMLQNICKKNNDKDSITPFQTLMMVLAGRIGVGSIAGVALAIVLGGMGSIFWMWVIGFLSAILSFVETFLGIKYKVKDEGHIYMGGPHYYIERGLQKRNLAYLYCIFVFLANVIGFLTIQANTITKAVNEMVPISPMFIALVMSIFTSFIIFGGIQRIASISSKLVPFMTFIYVGFSLLIVFRNVEQIPLLFQTIFREAFSLKPFFSGFLPCIIIGVQRGIFSSEAGLGTGAIAASTTSSNDALGQGYLQMIGVYITTMVICTSTAFVIFLSPYETLNLVDLNGIEITKFAFEFHFGSFGTILVFSSIILFSFSTILASYYDGESCLKYMRKRVGKMELFILKIGTIILLFIGAMVPSVSLWNYVDIMVAYLAIINTYAMFKLRNKVIERRKE